MEEELLQIVEELYEELENRDHGDSYVIDYNGDKIVTDTGYAFEGIQYFIKELKHKLYAKE